MLKWIVQTSSRHTSDIQYSWTDEIFWLLVLIIQMCYLQMYIPSCTASTAHRFQLEVEDVVCRMASAADLKRNTGFLRSRVKCDLYRSVLSLHFLCNVVFVWDALPLSCSQNPAPWEFRHKQWKVTITEGHKAVHFNQDHPVFMYHVWSPDRKSTRLNSSHL